MHRFIICLPLVTLALRLITTANCVCILTFIFCPFPLSSLLGVCLISSGPWSHWGAVSCLAFLRSNREAVAQGEWQTSRRANWGCERPGEAARDVADEQSFKLKIHKNRARNRFMVITYSTSKYLKSCSTTYPFHRVFYWVGKFFLTFKDGTTFISMKITHWKQMPNKAFTGFLMLLHSH